jgi:TonB-linked SusC/RagA family outer membrane protein
MKKNKPFGELFYRSLKKALKIMRNTIFLLILGVLQAHAIDTYSQKTKLSIDFSDASLVNVLDKIESESEFFFLYNEKLLDINRKVSITVKDQLLITILDDLFNGTDVKYTIIDRKIILAPEYLTGLSQPQQFNISGTVTDASTGEAIPGANVIVKGANVGALTDTNGKYSIMAPNQNAVLVFSFIGYNDLEQPVSGKTTVNVALIPTTQALDEVIVVGYGTKKKRDITGSISSISANTLAKTTSVSFTQALQGRIAGVYVKSNSGQPGGGVSVRIRGIGGLNNSEPLYVIDGIQMVGGTTDTYNSLAMINPNDIESLEVLKDASAAAIYGARGANGVVIITTKRGIVGKPQVSYSGSFGIQNLINPNNFGVLNAKEYAEVVNATVMADGLGAIFGGTNTVQYPPEYFPAPSSLGAGTDWIDEITNKNAPTQEHQLSVSGGNENHKYYLSLNYLNESGIIINTSFKRYSIRLNTDNTINKLLKVGNSLFLTNSSSNLIVANRSDEGGNFLRALMYAPTIPVYKTDGTFAGPPTSFYGPARNPVADILSPDIDNSRTNIAGNIYGELSILKGLSFKTTLSISLSLDTRATFTPTYSEGIVSKATTSVGTGADRGSGWRWSNVLSYSRDFGKHHLSSLIGTEANEGKSNSLSGSATYTDNSIRIVSSSGSKTYSFNQALSSSSMISYFGNLSYNFDNKYFIEGNIRRDGSSKFGKNSRWGTFPSFSAAWRISQESFFPKEIINELKLRSSYGLIGNDKIGDFAYIAGLKNVFYAFGGNNGSFSNGIAINGLANPDLKWETSAQMNVGLDLGMLKNKLSFTGEYFQTKVTDMLLGLPIPAVTGINASTYTIDLARIISNAGSLTNKGFEFEASYKDKIGKLFYGIGATLTTFNNKVTDIGNNDQIWGQVYQSQNVSRTVVGGSLGEFYGYVVDGIFQTQGEVDAANALGDPAVPYQNAKTAPGDFKFRDLNGDNVITADDRQVIGSPIPDFTYGLNLDLAYSNFDLTMLWAGTQGNDIYNANRMDLEASGRTYFNKTKAVLEAWSGPNTSNTVPRRIASDPNLNKRISSVFVEDGSFLSLRNIQLTYNLPESINSKLKLSSAKVYISGQNIITLTKYNGIDPEVGNVSGSNLSSGIDNDVYPHAKTVRLGVQVNF